MRRNPSSRADDWMETETILNSSCLLKLITFCPANLHYCQGKKRLLVIVFGTLILRTVKTNING